MLSSNEKVKKKNVSLQSTTYTSELKTSLLLRPFLAKLFVIVKQKVTQVSFYYKHIVKF